MQSPWLHGHQHIAHHSVPFDTSTIDSHPAACTAARVAGSTNYYPYPPQTLHGAVDPGRQHEADVLIDRMIAGAVL
jgi:hypothetical protein|eukprot:scaffold24586_cov111-Isochrysis_galbana.AAC.2